MEVMQNTNAERAGILKGDLLLSMDGKKISRVEEVLEQLQAKNFENLSLKVNIFTTIKILEPHF